MNLGILRKTLRLLLPAAVLAACAGDPRASDASAGRVVDNRSARWKAGEAWTVGPEAALRIGSEASGEYQFSGITGAVRLSDGRIVVADAGSSELRFFSPSGEFVRRVGRRGAGPAEFTWIARMVTLPGDSLLVFDAGASRLMVFGPGGEPGRTVSVPEAGPGSQFAGVLDDGRFVFGLPRAVPPLDGLMRDSVLYVLVSPGGEPVDTLGVAAGGLRFQRRTGNRLARMNPPFGPAAVAGARGDAVYFASTDEYAIHQHRTGEAVNRTIRRPVEAQAFTDADFQRILDQHPVEQAVIRTIPRPDRHPVLGPLLVDRTGHLWAQDFAKPGAADRSWAVFDPAGVFLGLVALSADLRVTDVGPGYVLGVAVDGEDGTESVRLHLLLRPGGG